MVTIQSSFERDGLKRRCLSYGREVGMGVDMPVMVSLVRTQVKVSLTASLLFSSACHYRDNYLCRDIVQEDWLY